MPDRDPTLEKAQNHAREVTGDPTVTLSDPVWFSHGTFTRGVAPRHADRAGALVGDARHLNLPIGGWGMFNMPFEALPLDEVGDPWRRQRQSPPRNSC